MNATESLQRRPRESFAVTYEIVTPESAESGDAEERGHILERGTLRDAIDELHKTRTCAVDGVECIESNNAFAVTVVNGPEFHTGAQESRTLHLPETLPRVTRERIVRLARGLRVLGRGRHVRAVWYELVNGGCDSYPADSSHLGIEKYCRAPDVFGIYERVTGGALVHVRDYPLRIMAQRELHSARPE